MKCPMCGSYLDDDGLCGECDVSDILDFAGRKEMEDQYTLTGLDTLTIGSDIDPVNKPIHYTNSKLECIEIIESMAENTSAEYVPHVTNIIRYLFRFEKSLLNQRFLQVMYLVGITLQVLHCRVC